MTSGPGRLAGRCALVTGAAGGIGGAIAEAYAREGANVCISDRSASSGLNAVAERCRRHGTSISHAVGDVADVGDVERIVAKATHELGGRIDVLVNAAGIATESSVEDMSVEIWDEMLRVDLRSVFLCSRAVLPGMLERGWGRIISIASQLGIKGHRRTRALLRRESRRDRVHQVTRAGGGRPRRAGLSDRPRTDRDPNPLTGAMGRSHAD